VNEGRGLSSGKKIVCIVASLRLQWHFTKLHVARITLHYLVFPNIGSLTMLAPTDLLPILSDAVCLLANVLHSHIPYANVLFSHITLVNVLASKSFLPISPNSFVPSISFLYAHRFDTFSLTVYAPLALLKLVLLKSVAYIFICTSISMLILSKPIYIINTYFIKRIFLLSPIPRTVMIPPVFSPHPSAESHLLPVNAGRAVSYAVLNQLPHSCHALA